MVKINQKINLTGTSFANRCIVLIWTNHNTPGNFYRTKKEFALNVVLHWETRDVQKYLLIVWYCAGLNAAGMSLFLLFILSPIQPDVAQQINATSNQILHLRSMVPVTKCEPFKNHAQIVEHTYLALQTMSISQWFHSSLCPLCDTIK